MDAKELARRLEKQVTLLETRVQSVEHELDELKRRNASVGPKEIKPAAPRNFKLVDGDSESHEQS